MGLFGGRKEIVTIAIESTDVRFLTARDRVYKWGSVPLAEGLVSGGVIADPLALGKIIDEMFHQHNLNRTRVVSSVPGLRAIPRLLSLPKVQASMLDATISREAKREMPVSLDNLYLSWQSLPSEGDQQRIYLLGVPKEMIDAQVRMFEAAGIRPLAMDLKPLALVRAVGREQMIIINLERDMLDIVLVANWVPVIMRTFSLDSQAMPIQERINHTLTDLNQTLRFYNDAHREAPILATTPIYACGRVFQEQEPFVYLRDAAGRPVERPLSPLPCPPDLPIASFLTNLGLAMKKVI